MVSCFYILASDGAGNRFVSGDSTAGDEVICISFGPR